MNWEGIEGNWDHYKGNAKRHWLRLTEQELELTAGRREQLSGKVQQAYCISKEQAEKQVSSWQEAQKVVVHLPKEADSPGSGSG